MNYVRNSVDEKSSTPGTGHKEIIGKNAINRFKIIKGTQERTKNTLKERIL